MQAIQLLTDTSMRFLSLLMLTLILSVSFSTYTFAADSTSDKLEPLPPPPAIDDNVDNEPQVTITKQTEQTIEEYRVGGKLYMIKVIPKIGKPYYLVDERGDGKFTRQESLDSGVRPPRWVIHKF